MKGKIPATGNGRSIPDTRLRKGRGKRKSNASSRKLTSSFPFVDCLAPRLFADPQKTWTALLEDLSSARHRILLENYILRESSAGEAVVDQLVQAAEKGASVHVHLDGFGSMPVVARTRDRLERAGVVLRVFNDPTQIASRVFRGLRKLLNRTHRRIIVIDDQVAWIGGLGISDRWWPGQSKPAARDIMLRFTGPLVAQAVSAFEHLWENPDHAIPSSRIAEALPGQARVVNQHAPLARRFRSLLYSRIKECREQIWMATPYFIPSLRLRRVLRHAARAGIDVRLLLPGPLHHDHPTARMVARRHYARLLQVGVRIFEYQPAFFHSKMALFDDEWVIVGSANLDNLSFFTNHELVVEARHPLLAATARKQFEKDFESCQEILLETWLRRPLLHRLLERFDALFERFL